MVKDAAWAAEPGSGEPGSSNNSCREGSSPPGIQRGMKMRKRAFIILIFLFMAVSPVFAQWGGGTGRHRVPLSDTPCWTKPYLETTPEQMKSLEDLQRSFRKEIAALSSQQIQLRYDLRALMDHPKPETKMIFVKQNNLSVLQKQIDEISIQYLLKGRAIFTLEQLSNLPPGCNLGFNYGQGTGWGRGMGQRNRF